MGGGRRDKAKANPKTERTECACSSIPHKAVYFIPSVGDVAGLKCVGMRDVSAALLWVIM